MSTCGRAVFEVGTKIEVVEFDTLAELREKEDNLTWLHWPEELKIVSLNYKPAKATAAKKAA